MCAKDNFIVMKIEERLQFTAHYSAQQVCLFNEGIFVRAYNQSAYILTVLMGMPFKVSYRSVQKLQGKPVVYCRFPISKLTDYFDGHIKTHWGYIVKIPSVLNGYDHWFNMIIQQTTSDQMQLSICTTQLPSVATTNVAATNGRSKVELTLEQEHFLKNWQPNIWPLKYEQNFIASLKKQLK